MPNNNASTMHTNKWRSSTLVLVYLLCWISSCRALDDSGKIPALSQPKVNPNNKTILPSPPIPPKQDLSKVAAEGGTISVQKNPSPAGTTTNNNDMTHMGREHVVTSDVDEKHNVTLLNATKVDNKEPSNNQSSSVETQEIKGEKQPITPSPDDSYLKYGVAEKNDDKQSVPKKGVEFPAEATNTNVSALAVKPTYSSANVTSSNNTTLKTPTHTTTVKIRPKKPTITEAHDDEPKPSSDSHQSKTNVSTASGTSKTQRQPIPDIPSIDSVTSEDSKKQQRQADYVVPIVAVILSVPLVAIIISVLYKRGAEWWQHRHYRRMDFLIDGMYNN